MCTTGQGRKGPFFLVVPGIRPLGSCTDPGERFLRIQPGTKGQLLEVPCMSLWCWSSGFQIGPSSWVNPEASCGETKRGLVALLREASESIILSMGCQVPCP